MLFISSILLFLVGLMHSVLGGCKLIAPLIEREDFPILLGSQKNARLTLWFGWHALTLFWWAQAIVLVSMAVDLENTAQMTLASLAFASGSIGVTALFVSKGKHLSWIFFLPLAVALICEFWTNATA